MVNLCQAWITCDGKSEKIKEEFLKWWPETGEKFIFDRYTGKDPASEDLLEEDYFDDELVDAEPVEKMEIDAALMHEVIHDRPTALTPAQALITVEDRHEMVRKLAALQEQQKQEHRGQGKPNQSLLAMETSKKSSSEGNFAKILKAV